MLLVAKYCIITLKIIVKKRLNLAGQPFWLKLVWIRP